MKCGIYSRTAFIFSYSQLWRLNKGGVYLRVAFNWINTVCKDVILSYQLKLEVLHNILTIDSRLYVLIN